MVLMLIEEGIAALIRDPRNEEAVRAAKHLWRHARRGHDLTAANDALESAASDGHPHVRYFAGMALAQWARRRGAEPPGLPSCPENPEPDIGGREAPFYNERYGSTHAASRAESHDAVTEVRPHWRCGVCGSKALECIFHDGFGSNSGGEDTYECHCLECGKYTLFDTEWG